MATREQNERRFKQWQDFADGGRRYWTDRRGIISGFQRLIKIVDEHEKTMQIVQEIYNEEGILIERHQKYPVDSGHERIVDEE